MPEPIQFPDIELYRGWGEPMRTECKIEGLELIEGEIPAALEGALYKVGADRQYPSDRTDDIFIDGEGMIHMFRFKDQQVDYCNRWVRTTRYDMQKQARRRLFGRYRNRYTNDPSVDHAVSMGTANTTAMFHAGHLYALKEDDLPYEIDPETLETIGRSDMEGQIGSVSFTAHPKVDPVKDEMLGFSYQAKGDGTKDIVFFVFDRDGRKINEVAFEMPYPGMVHDFAITDDYVVFPFFPMMTDMDNVRQGGAYYEYHPDKPTHVALVPRYGSVDGIRWFEGPNATAGHMMNAVRDGDKVMLDVCYYEGNCFDFFPTPSGDIAPMVPPFLTRLTFDLSSNESGYSVERLLNVPVEMPKTDDRYQGRHYRHGYCIARAQDGSSGTGHVDLATGKLAIWKPGEGDMVQECQFVPRSPDAAEGDGWLLVPVNRVSKNRSDLAILDATDVEAGPVALLKLPFKVRATFHGTWVPEATLQSGNYNFSLAEG